MYMNSAWAKKTLGMWVRSIHYVECDLSSGFRMMMMMILLLLYMDTVTWYGHKPIIVPKFFFIIICRCFIAAVAVQLRRRQ